LFYKEAIAHFELDSNHPNAEHCECKQPTEYACSDRHIISKSMHRFEVIVRSIPTYPIEVEKQIVQNAELEHVLHEVKMFVGVLISELIVVTEILHHF